jgi:hypothetical protein
MINIPARVAKGINAAHFPITNIINSNVIEWTIPATGVRPPFLTFVAVRAMAPVAGIPPKIDENILAVPCATSSIFDLWLPPIIPSETTADNNDSIPPSKAMVKAG